MRHDVHATGVRLVSWSSANFSGTLMVGHGNSEHCIALLLLLRYTTEYIALPGPLRSHGNSEHCIASHLLLPPPLHLHYTLHYIIAWVLKQHGVEAER